MILPKPRAPPKQPPRLKPRATPSDRPQKCPVPGCPRRDCPLQTHKNFVASRDSSRQTISARSVSRQTSPLVGSPSGLPELPLGNDQPPAYRVLFHDFFSRLYDRIAVLVAPPPLTAEGKAKMKKHKRDMLQRSLETPVYCLNYVASSFVATSRPAQDRDTALLYGRVMTLLREKLASFTTDEVDNLMVVIVTLVLLDLIAGRHRDLEIHRRGMSLLVNSRGGLHNLDSS
jgi:hypothetical protein